MEEEISKKTENSVEREEDWDSHGKEQREGFEDRERKRERRKSMMEKVMKSEVER